MPELEIIDETETKSTTAAKKKTSSASGKTTSSTAKKKSTSTSRKTSSSTQLRLTAAEKKLVQNYRKCNAIEKELIAALTEKLSGKLLAEIAGSGDSALMNFLNELLKD